MSISDLYASGKHKEEIGHFANIVKIAKADGIISDLEEALLIKSAQKLNITTEEYIVIFNHPEKFPVNPPISYDERIERLYRLTKMLLVNGEVHLRELTLLSKVAIGLHFPSTRAQKVCNKAIDLVTNKTDLDTFIIEIKKVDKS